MIASPKIIASGRSGILSVGSVANSCAYALATTMNGIWKAEMIHQRFSINLERTGFRKPERLSPTKFGR